MRQRGIFATLVIGAVVAAQPGWTQDSSGITDSVFTNPGARSIGLGGAFAAIADDATAAFANPAGLMQILRPEISAEIRGTTSTLDTGVPYELAGGVSGLGFLSFVYPFRSWAFALYSHQLASVDLTFTEIPPSTRELSVRSYSGAAAFQVGENLSFGAGLSYFTADQRTDSGSARISDADWSFNAGILWNAAPAWRIAGFYRRGPEFESDVDSGRVALKGAPNLPLKDVATPPRLAFPDEYGLGVAFQPKGGGWTFGVEWDRAGSATDTLLAESAVTEGGSEYHLGAEYAFLRWKPVVAFRAGFWREPGGMRAIALAPGIVITASTGSVAHGAFGVGLAFRSFQIDLGADFSDRATIGSLSIVYSF